MSIMVFLLVWMMVLMIVFSLDEWTVVKIVLVYVEDNVLHIAGYSQNTGVQNSNAPGGVV